MLSPLRLFFYFLALPPTILGIILFFAIDNSAITQRHWSLTNSDIQRAKYILSNSTLKSQKSLQLSEKELNIALSYLLNYYIDSRSKITVEKSSLHFAITLLLEKDYFGKYLNLTFNLTKKDGLPVIHSLQIGNIKIADEFAGYMLESIIKYTPLKEYYILVSQHVRNITIIGKNLIINYIPSPDIALINKLSLSKKNFQSVIFYQHEITKIIAGHNPRMRLSLARLLQPLFKLAYQRSIHENAIFENRAVLIAISTYVYKEEIQAYLPYDISPVTSRQFPPSLYRRTDMAKHFMISAALAATGAEALGQLIGQEKEVIDSKQGSGFSFIDLASDRVGLKFGKIAVASESRARKLQKQMSTIKNYRAFMPEFRDLPEKMNNRVFHQQYKSVNSVQYQKMLKKIDQRIAALDIYK